MTQPRVWCDLWAMGRAVHGSGQVGFEPDPDSTRLDRVTKIATRNWPNIWVRPDGSGHQLIGSGWSVWRVWASIWAEFVILHKFFFNSIFDRPFGTKLMGLFLTRFIYFWTITYGPLFTPFISNWAFNSAYIKQLLIFWSSKPYQYKFNVSSSELMTTNTVNNIKKTWAISKHIKTHNISF